MLYAKLDEASKKRHYIDLTGQVFGRLTVLHLAGSIKQSRIWECDCACGNKTHARTENLRSGNTLSCGCLQPERASRANKTHGATVGCRKLPRLYYIWASMKRRCHSPSSTSFSSYGGKGVIVCPEWHAFQPFRDWALANGYASNLTIDRINPHGNYEPTNCRWASRIEQRHNRRADWDSKVVSP